MKIDEKMKNPYENGKNPYFLKFRMVSKIRICTDKSVRLATLLYTTYFIKKLRMV